MKAIQTEYMTTISCVTLIKKYDILLCRNWFCRGGFIMYESNGYPDWVNERFGDDIPAWAEERWGDIADKETEDDDD